jgi:DNA-binding NarL/FixJ family response regulator
MDSNSQSTFDNKCLESHASSIEFDRDAKFLAMLPRIRRQAGYCLRHVSKKERADAIQEVVARSFIFYLRLIERGKSDRAFAGPLARYGACQYLSGRRVGNCMNSHDVTSAYCRQRKKIMVEQLDRFDDPTSEWEQLVVEDKHSTPADVAATRVDFRAWLESLPVRTRHVAETLATGEATKNVARMFGCSASRISQLRRELHDGWLLFTGEVAAVPSSVLA